MDSLTQDNDLEFIKLHWKRLANVAWRGHQQKGRGAVFIYTGDVESLDVPIGQLRILYISKKLVPDIGPKLKRMINEYNPREQIVFQIGEKQEKRLYRLRMKPFPPDADVRDDEHAY